ncbi:MAG TPA: 23S rRNA pseudouridine(2604) synthase RluF [Clostridiales bacterium]|nr:23S rRNA pseudouridine(2604) synthase RluF [Clostridiales bacterium]
MAKRTKKLTSQGDEKDEIRINKFLSDAGICSRREADRYITEGKVKIDGEIAQMGSKVTKDSVVTFLDQPVRKEEKLVLIAFNKPEGIVCTTDQREPDNIIDFINYGMRIYPVGRLDKDSEGLILLTNDGDIVNKILRAEHQHEKEYIVHVNKEITADFIQEMSAGVPILDTVTNPCKVTQLDKYTFNIILTQGLNRQIRRMCEYLGYRVVGLTRIRIMNIQLGRLKVGDYRNVTEKEIEELNQAFEQQKEKKAEKGTEAKREQGRREPGKKEQGRREPGKKEQGRREPGKKEQGRREPGKKEQDRGEPGKKEQDRREQGKSGAEKISVSSLGKRDRSNPPKVMHSALPKEHNDRRNSRPTGKKSGADKFSDHEKFSNSENRRTPGKYSDKGKRSPGSKKAKFR